MNTFEEFVLNIKKHTERYTLSIVNLKVIAIMKVEVQLLLVWHKHRKEEHGNLLN